MSIKKIIQLFIPPFIYKIKNIFKLAYFNKYSPLPKHIKLTDHFCILGNGPSLSDSLKNNINFIKKSDFIVVNNFCKTKYFSELKPKFYLISDPNNLINVFELSDFLKQETLDMIKCFQNVNWQMTFFLPDYAIKGDLYKSLLNNKNITILLYNTKNLFLPSLPLYKKWNLNLIAPPSQTVLNTALYIGIYNQYKDIYIFGADTSWIELLKVDQKTNLIYTIDKHFYGEEKRILYSDIYGKIPSKLYEELDSISKALKSYWELKDYAQYNGTNVYNSSAYSLIDAFERRQPK